MYSTAECNIGLRNTAALQNTVVSVSHTSKNSAFCVQSVFTRVVPKVMSNFFLHANWE